MALPSSVIVPVITVGAPIPLHVCLKKTDVANSALMVEDFSGDVFDGVDPKLDVADILYGLGGP